MRKIAIITALVAFITSCTKSIEDFNDNPKAPETVPASMLYANAQKDLVSWMSSTNVNVNTFRLWAQHWTETTYTDEANYELVNRNINGRAFNTLYAGVLRDLYEARKQLDADENLSDADRKAQEAMIDVLECYVYHVLVDVFNDVPYSEAMLLADDLAPAFDDASGIYADLISRLKTDAADLVGGSTGDIGGSDNIYGGDGAMWAAFANSLRLKMALRTGNESEASDASAGAFSSSAYDALFYYESTTPNTNPLWEDLVQSGRYDFIASGTLADYMTATNDPRAGVYFQNNLTDSTGAVTVVGPQHGMGSAYNNNSQPGAEFMDPTHPGQLMTYYEVEFLRAHLAAMQGNAGDAETHYHDAVMASMSFWGVDAASADAYYAQDAVNYATQAAAGKSWEEIIGSQKWVSMYDNGFEAWSTWRLYDYPAMQEAAEAQTVPPTRWNYSIDEYSVNNAQVSAANGGNDSPYDKVFWDTK